MQVLYNHQESTHNTLTADVHQVRKTESSRGGQRGTKQGRAKGHNKMAVNVPALYNQLLLLLLKNRAQAQVGMNRKRCWKTGLQKPLSEEQEGVMGKEASSTGTGHCWESGDRHPRTESTDWELPSHLIHEMKWNKMKLNYIYIKKN